MKLITAIKHEKKKLIDKANEGGLYENFGQNEVRKLKDKFIDLSDYSPQMNNSRELIDSFDNWCMNYCI